MTKKITALQVKGSYDLASPAQMVSLAEALKHHVLTQNLYTNIMGKNYVHVEGWQFAGGLIGMYPRVQKVENLSNSNEIKYMAEVAIVSMKDGKIISRGFAVCSNKEGKMKSFDEYAILSMAQTRAIGKAYRNVIGWVMKLAGYEATPSEEMFKMGETPKQTPTAPQKKETTRASMQNIGIPKYECHESGCPMTKAEYDYSKRMFGKPFCREHQKNRRKKTPKKYVEK